MGASSVAALLASTALGGVLTLSLASPALAECSDNAPATDGQMVTCDANPPNPDPDGVFGNAGIDDVDVTVLPGAEIVNNDGGGVYAEGSGWTVTNEGAISGNPGGTEWEGVFLGSDGTVVNETGATITGGDDGVRILAGTGDVINRGSIISNSANGVSIFEGTVTNEADALIDGEGAGVILFGSGTVDNAGEIAGDDNAAVSLLAGGSVFNAASGLIHRGNHGVLVEGGAGFIHNFGAIHAINSPVIRLRAGGEIINEAGARIDAALPGLPDVYGLASGIVLEMGGSITNRGTILGGIGAAITATGATTIRNEAGGVVRTPEGTAVFLSGTFDITNAGMIEGVSPTGTDFFQAINIAGGSSGTITNQIGGRIAGPGGGIVGGGDVDITNAGEIDGGNYFGIAGFSGTLLNQVDGVISGAAGVSASVLVDNSGTITGAGGGGFGLGDGVGVQLFGGGNVINRAGGEIVGNANGGFAVDVLDGGTVENAGLIRGAGPAGGVQIGGGTAATNSVTNLAGGTIVGEGFHGVRLEDGGTITNHGTITGSGFIGGSGVFGGGATIVGGGTLTNTGTITADQGFAASLSGGGTIDNSGTIADSRAAGVPGLSGGLSFQGGLGGTVSNTGTISSVVGPGLVFGSTMTGGFTEIVNAAGAEIVGGENGISGSQGEFLITNHGRIAGSDAVEAALFVSNSDGTLVNTGTIENTAGDLAIFFTGANSQTFSNAGIVDGDVWLDLGDDEARLTAGQTLNGLLDGGGGADLLAFDGGAGTSAALDIAQVAGFETAEKAGAGVWTLTGANAAFAPDFAVNAGTLIYNATSPGVTMTVNSTARLGGTGTVGDLTVNGTIAPGNSIGTFHVDGNLVLNSTSELDYELGTPGASAASPGQGDLIVVQGHLTLDGELSVTDVGGFGDGVYRLIEYGGTLTDNGLIVASLPGTATGTVQTSVNGQVNLVVDGAGPIDTAILFWDGTSTIANGNIEGGTATWNNSTTNWTIADGSANVAWADKLAVFTAAPGTVTIAPGGVSATGLQFAVDGYTIQGDTLTLTGGATLRVGDGTSDGADMTAIIASTIAGSNGLNKTDLGTLVLTGNNTYTGGTTINAGTVRISADTALGDASGGVTLNGGLNGATLAFASAMSTARDFTIGGSGNTFLLEGGTVTLSGLLSGAGELAKRGDGLLHYTGDGSGYTGDFSLLEGGMRFDGTLAGSVITSAGTTLWGIGEIGNLRVGGRLEPGASIGTLTVTGDLTLESGSTYVVELNDAGNVAGVNNDLVVADTGTIESGVTMHVTPENGTDTGSTYAPQTIYTVIQTGAAGNLTVDADPTITDNFAFLNFTGSSDGQNYYLTSHQVVSFCLPSATFNQCSTANAVQDLGAGHLAYDSVLLLSEPEANAAFDAMSGEVHASGQHVVDQTFALFNRTLRYQGIAGIGAGNFGANVAAVPAGDYADTRVRGAWAAPLGAYGRIDSDGNAARLEWWNAGLAGGYEGVIDVDTGNAVGGFGFGYIRSHGSIPDRRSSFDGDGFYLGAYGAWNDGPWTVAGALSYGTNRVSTERGIVFGTINETATTDYWAHTIGLSGEASYAFDLTDSTKLAPLFTLDTGWSGHGGFTERGAGAFNLTSGSESWTRFDTGIGLALTHTVLTEHGKLTLEGRAVWEHAFADVVPDTMNSFVGGAPFEIRGPAAAADRLRLGAGLSWTVSDDMTVRARYDGLFSGDQSSHAASLGLNVRF